MKITGSIVYIRDYEAGDAADLLDLRSRNQGFFAPWEPRRPGMPSTVSEQRRVIEAMNDEARDDVSYSFGIFAADDGRLVGQIRLTQIFRGPLQRAVVGYFVDERENSKGFATEALKLTLRAAFDEFGLHRVEAGAMPRNVASNRVLEKVGMRLEGFAPRYLEINGVWEDHNLYAIDSEEASTSGHEPSA